MLSRISIQSDDEPRQPRLYAGSFTSVSVVADEYYNIRLLELQVGDQPPIPVPSLAELQPQYGGDLAAAMESNAIVDSGTNSTALTSSVYQQMLQSFAAISPNFQQAIDASCYGVRLGPDALRGWPSIFVTLAGPSSDARLEMKPSSDWQLDATRGRASIFNINSDPSPQSILGLPLMNNYFVVFDRSAGAEGSGEIKFAAQAAPKPTTGRIE